MTERSTIIVAGLGKVLHMQAEEILRQSLQGFLKAKLMEAQCRVGQLYLDDQQFSRKYGMDRAGLNQALDALDEEPQGREAQTNGVSHLEAVADSRWWEHVVEDLAAAMVQVEQLQLLQGTIPVGQSQSGPGRGV